MHRYNIIAGKLKGINDEVDEMEMEDGNRKELVLRMYDVKSMFTALPSTEILESVDKLIALAGEQKWGRNTHTRCIIVPKRKEERAEATRIATSSKLADADCQYAFTFQQVIITFDGVRVTVVWWER